MSEEDCDDRDPDDPAVDSLIRAFEEAQIADQQRNLEEADTELVEWTAGEVDASIGNKILLRAKRDRQPEAEFCFCELGR